MGTLTDCLADDGRSKIRHIPFSALFAERGRRGKGEGGGVSVLQNLRKQKWLSKGKKRSSVDIFQY